MVALIPESPYTMGWMQGNKPLVWLQAHMTLIVTVLITSFLECINNSCDDVLLVKKSHECSHITFACARPHFP